jgi:hypothetical protein
MHPELLRALARARHADLVNEQPIRARPTVRSGEHPRPFRRSRQRVGSLLIWAGARLVDDQRAALELAHK